MAYDMVGIFGVMWGDMTVSIVGRVSLIWEDGVTKNIGEGSSQRIPSTSPRTINTLNRSMIIDQLYYNKGVQVACLMARSPGGQHPTS